MKKLTVLSLMMWVAVAGIFASWPAQMYAQEPAEAGTNSSARKPSTGDPGLHRQTQASRLGYVRPSRETRLTNYFFDAFGPYPLVGAAIVGGINQADNTPPEWGQGAAAYGKRVGSNYGIAAVTQTTRYALSEVLHEDTLYYRCACKGFVPRLGHALVSTLISRRGDEGHRIFSVPSLVAPYAGTMTATYGWFPGRYGAKDAFRMGNYNLLALAVGNVAIEFLYRGPHSFLSKVYLNNRHAAPDPEPDR
jgi:hypothetical protein